MAVIKVDFGRSTLASSGITEAFLNQMQVLRDSRAWSAGAGAEAPRFGESTLRYLERTLFNRGADLRDAIFQLSHLVAAAAEISPRGRALDVLFGYDQPVRAGPIAAYLAGLAADAQTERVRAEENALVIEYRGDARYSLAKPRLPLLFALLEFALTAPDAPERAEAAHQAITRIEQAGDSFEAVKSASNNLANMLAGQLDELLRDRGERDRFEAVARFLDAHAVADPVETGAETWVIDDDAVLGFWLEAVTRSQEAEDFRKFETVHRAFVSFLAALGAGLDWQALHRGRASADDEEHFLQISEEAGQFDTLDEAAPTPLDHLAEPPSSAIKFLNRNEERGLQIPVRLWGPVRELPLSVLRSELMGGAQNEIINAVRFRRPVEPLIALEQLGSEERGESNYRSVAGRYQGLREHIVNMRRAAAHVASTRRGFALPEDRAKEFRKAFRAYRRAGFDRAFDDPEIGEGFEAAIGPLSELAALIAALCPTLPEDLEGQFEADREIFRTAFGELYAKEA